MKHLHKEGAVRTLHAFRESSTEQYARTHLCAACDRASAWLMDVDVIWVRAYGTSPTSSGHVFGSMKAKNDASFFGLDAVKCPSVRARTVQHLRTKGRARDASVPLLCWILSTVLCDLRHSIVLRFGCVRRAFSCYLGGLAWRQPKSSMCVVVSLQYVHTYSTVRTCLC